MYYMSVWFTPVILGLEIPSVINTHKSRVRPRLLCTVPVEKSPTGEIVSGRDSTDGDDCLEKQLSSGRIQKFSFKSQFKSEGC